MTVSNMTCDYCGNLVTSDQKRVVSNQNEERKPGLQVAGEGTFSKGNLKLYHNVIGLGTPTNTIKTCAQQANATGS